MATRTVYLLRDASGSVLYVGCTFNLRTRLINLHRKAWWANVASVDQFDVPEDQAADAERTAIEKHRPPHNQHGTTQAYHLPRNRSLRSAVEKLLEPADLEGFVRARRDDGQSWRAVAVDIYEATGLSITHETLRAWFPDNAEDAA